MEKPQDFDIVQPYGTFTPLKTGGHICKIMQVRKVKSSSGKEMIAISLDIAEGEQKGYYSAQYKNDNRPNKKWGSVVNQLVYDNEGGTNRGFKTFTEAVEKSNKGFKVAWGNAFESCFKGKLVGGVFGREQYRNQKGELKFSVKCMQFKSVEEIRNGVEAPEDKILQDSYSSNSSGYDDFTAGMNSSDEFDFPF